MALFFAISLLAANRMGNVLAQTILVSLGSAIFGAGLTFFWLRMTDQSSGQKPSGLG